MNCKLINFSNWMKSQAFFLSPKISIIHGDQSNYGVIATGDIEKDEVIFQIPRKAILSIHNSDLCEKLVQENVLESSKWGSLILCIFHELFLGEKSQWFHYLKLFPNFDNLRLPMFWNESELKLLHGTGIEATLHKDLEMLTKDYCNCVVPFIKKYPHCFEEGISLEKFKYYVAFVMAYSFTKHDEEEDDEEEDSESNDSDCEDASLPYMVPMADVLNHVSRNNAELIYGETELSMVAVTAIKSGSEVFNTYGALPNTQLLQQYGFSLSSDENDDDVIEMNIAEIPRQECTELVAQRLDKMAHLTTIVLCKNGFLNTYELAFLLYTLHSDDAEFQQWIESISTNEPWEETDEDVEIMADYLVDFETLRKVPQSWRTIIRAIVCQTIAAKKEALNNNMGAVNTHLTGGKSSPAMFVRLVLESHLSLLENVLKYL